MLFPERPITVDHIRAFCSRFNEGYRVEYKSTLDSSVREKLPKVISSFANSHGGVLVVGVNTKNGVPQPPFQGFQASKPEEYALTVENICLQGIYPPIFPQTITVESDVPGHFFLVIEVAESGQTPHAIENSKRVYVRTGNAANPSDLANIDLILGLVRRRNEPFELRERLLTRAKKRFSVYLEKKRMDLSGGGNPGPLLQLSVGPRFPTRPLCGQERVVDVVQKSGTPWRGLVFPYQGSPSLSQHESAIVLDAGRGISCIFFEVSIWGMLFYGSRLSFDTIAASGVNASAFLGYILLFIQHAGKLLQLLDYQGPTMVEVDIGPILRAGWRHAWYGYPQLVPGSELDEEVSIVVSTSTEVMQTNPDSVAKEVFRQVFYSVNCPEFVNTPSALEGLVRKGYDFNGWA